MSKNTERYKAGKEPNEVIIHEGECKLLDPDTPGLEDSEDREYLITVVPAEADPDFFHVREIFPDNKEEHDMVTEIVLNKATIKKLYAECCFE